MSKSKSSSIGIGGLIFWAWVAWLFFGSDGDKKEKKVEKPKDEKPAIVEQTKDVLKSIQKETKDVIEIAKKELKQSINNFKEKPDEKKEEKIEEKVEEDLLEIEDIKIKSKPTFRKL